jgi:hypothetical protein
MNWKRGITRVYLVLWFIWAVTLTWAGILSNLKYGPPIREAPINLVSPDSTVDQYAPTTQVPTGPARLHFEDLGLDQAMTTLAFAFVVPAFLLMAFRWIITGFRGSGTQPPLMGSE